ncbi:hypothetical protein C8R46DRAFT_1092981 [Mycena filopes]|nr:hypothetical protein C8R46DRAFT_1092981 [Mycena filopes]
MDPEPHSDDKYTSPSATDEQEFASYGDGMFAGSQNFSIAGGTFTNVTNCAAAPAAPTDFRMIPLGDIDLQYQLSVQSGSGRIGRRRGRRGVRRVYSANIGGRQSSVTVAMYQGDGAEEDWREEIERYMAVRHPNIVQVCAGARCGNIHATVFHGDLVPLKQYMARHSPIMSVYLYAGFSYEYTRVSRYLCGTLRWPIDYTASDFQMWIRRSTGRLCVDLSPPSPGEWKFSPSTCHNEGIASAIASSRILHCDAEAIESLPIEEYHETCSGSLSLSCRIHIAPSETVSFGAVVHRHDADAAIAASVDLGVACQPKWWRNGWPLGEEEEDCIEDRWTRYQADDVFDAEFSVLPTSWSTRISEAGAWLSQAHHVLTCHQINMSHLEDYVVVDYLEFILSISGPSTTPPPGYFFLCPPEAFKTGPSTFKWPDYPAYWSLDPSGIDRLSPEEATLLGFPSMELKTQVSGKSWDASVYAGLRQFHQGKGFDPDSQDVIRHMGYPLYRVCEAITPPFAHEEVPVEEEVNVKDEESGATPTLNEPPEHNSMVKIQRDTENPSVDSTSPWFNFVMHTQLALILFIFICGIYEPLS